MAQDLITYNGTAFNSSTHKKCCNKRVTQQHELFNGDMIGRKVKIHENHNAFHKMLSIFECLT